jgi:hypothetical protein
MPNKIERLGVGAKYGLRVTVEDDGSVKFTITSGGGKKQHANATLHPIAANGVARHILSKGRTSRPNKDEVAYTLAQLRNGSGFAPGARFVQVESQS